MRALKPVGILLALACAASGIGAAPARAQDPAAAPPAFAPDAVPVSEAPLGRFPYFALPDGYQPLNPPETREFGHFLFWTGTALHEVEGRVFLSLIGPRDGKTFSAYELRKNVEAVLTQAGGRKIADGQIPASVTETLPEDIRVGMYEGLGNVYGAPAQTWVIRRPDRQIWVHFVPDSNGAAWTILETRPFVQTAALLPAEQLKQDLDRTGKAVIRVNFATDRTEILPASAPQIDAVAALLRTDPGLRLAINGHTDGTGAAAHNRTLSDGRAKAVMAKLVAAGIARDRLRAQGFGAASPVAANDGEAGRAQNRRVELVRF
ncbi:OmpA family protein [Methylobacterium sp. NMS14P]|uniref:OmpA family protein n=1 Tax=Methylobacterium sp. NMS14P TaxID=2894310 RepID=UPI002358FDC2|nr:OmpA family protein [Methylobacterium sp. NMS14P]WCS23842.1 OmpA family protein [Methylobacterium sp. NMS14P]